MAIVDHYYFRERPGMTNEEKDTEVRQRLQLQYEHIFKAASDFQVKKERAIKLRSMKTYLYGKYICKIPAFQTNQYADTPLPESFAEPYNPDVAPVINFTEHKYGQTLRGDMIPTRDIHACVPKEPKCLRDSLQMSSGGMLIETDEASPTEMSPLLRATSSDGSAHE